MWYPICDAHKVTVGFEPRTFKKVSILNPRYLKGSRYLIFNAHKVIISAASPFFKTCFLINSDPNLGYTGAGIKIVK